MCVCVCVCEICVPTVYVIKIIIIIPKRIIIYKRLLGKYRQGNITFERMFFTVQLYIVLRSDCRLL